MRQRISDWINNRFPKMPGEDHPNGLGCIVIALFYLTLAAGVLLTFSVVGVCSGCAHTSSVTRRTPGGDVTVRSESYAGGLVSSYNEEFDSDGDYQRCLADRRSQRVAGGSWIWSDDQMTCYWQNAGSGVGGGGFGGGYGYGWSAPPSLVITPGIR